MSTQDCCNQNCRQGRDCPQRLVRDAAPDLLAALVGLRNSFKEYVGPNCTAADAAIAKATGTTP